MRAADIVVARVSVIAPVEVPAIVIVPLPLASIVRFSLVPEDNTLRAKPPAAAADFIFKPVAADAVEASMLKVGLVVPFGPTAKAFAEALVIVGSQRARNGRTRRQHNRPGCSCRGQVSKRS